MQPSFTPSILTPSILPTADILFQTRYEARKKSAKFAQGLRPMSVGRGGR